MKRTITLLAFLIAVIGGLTLFNMYFSPEKLAADQLAKEKAAAEKLEEAEAESMAEMTERLATQAVALAEENAEAEGGLALAAPEDPEAAAEKPVPSPAGPDATEATKKPEEKSMTQETVPAPDVFKVKFECSNGTFTMEAQKEWAPLGAQRLHDLVRSGYYDGNRFFRVVPGFVVQFGLNGDPAVSKKWKNANLKDEPVVKSNLEGYVSYASAGPNSRTTQIFINLGNNTNLDNYQQGFMPFARVVEGMDVVQAITSKYGQNPDQGRIHSEGNAYLEEAFPEMDYVIKATIVE